DGVISDAQGRGALALVAVGGYARRELCFRSDVDLLLLTDGSADAVLGPLAEKLLYPLWDCKLQVGQSVGTVAQILEAGDADPLKQHALLDLRFLAGSGALYDALTHGVAARLDAGWRASLIARVRPENLRRWSKYGESVFRLEPHVKEGKGGLRDLHWLLWIGRALRGLRGDMDLLLGGIVDPAHYRAMSNAHEFLLRVRNQLHVRAGRAEDRLLFEHQEPIARALGFRKSRGLLAAEHFMGAYYRHAYNLAHFAGLYAARLLGYYWDEPEDGVDALTLGPSAPVARVPSERVEVSENGLFRLEGGSVRCTDPSALVDPRVTMQLFVFLQDVGGRLHHDTMEEVRASLPRLTRKRRSDPEIGASFRGLLEGGDIFRVLVAMHRSGFLGRYIPEFGAVFCQAQHNRVHLYTVDVHSLYAVRELERLGEDDVAADAPLFARSWRTTEHRGPLILAALFHDIAKAHGSAHSRVGAEWMPRILGRMGWESPAIKRVQWLVQHHLVLSETAYHRDVHDPRTLAELRAIIPDRSHLEDLMALTFADTRATNPELWSGWKQSLLEEAYRAAVMALDPSSPEGALPDIDVVGAQVEALLMPEVGRKRAPALVQRLLEVPVKGQPRYLERNSPEVLATHAILIDQLTHAAEHAASAPFVSHVRDEPGRGASEWTVASQDQRGLFSLLAGVLGSCGLSIASASAVTRDDGVAIDTFWVTDLRGRRVDAARWRRVDRTLSAVARGEQDLSSLLAKARTSAPPAESAGALGLARVVVSNEVSESSTVVEIVTQDRVGLLHDITAILRDFDLDLIVARIATRHDMASDTFYLVDQRGRKLPARRVKVLRRELEDALLTEQELAAGRG
ncbi:MAG: [protein-PII] uridylyltransferase, partial [Deltaproteobacteria bacterium]|nr:[protein-PII] uridylyltransferase [Deltaproteobacteria bacterium]